MGFPRRARQANLSHPRRPCARPHLIPPFLWPVGAPVDPPRLCRYRPSQDALVAVKSCACRSSRETCSSRSASPSSLSGRLPSRSITSANNVSRSLPLLKVRSLLILSRLRRSLSCSSLRRAKARPRRASRASLLILAIGLLTPSKNSRFEEHTSELQSQFHLLS